MAALQLNMTCKEVGGNMSAFNQTTEDQDIFWLIWMIPDGFFSLGLVLTKTTLLVLVPMTDWVYQQKLCFITCHSAGLFYAVIRLISMFISLSLQTEKLSSPLCFTLIQLQLLGFVGYYVLSTIAIHLISMFVMRPMYDGTKHARVAFVLAYIIVFLWTLLPVPVLSQIPANKCTLHQQCTWNVLPHWYTTGTVFGPITICFVYNLVTGVRLSRTLWLQLTRTSIHPAPSQPDTVNSTVPPNSSPKRVFTILYSMFTLLLPVILYMDRGQNSDPYISSLVTWTVLTLLTMLSDICTLQNRSLTLAAIKLWAKCKNR